MATAALPAAFVMRRRAPDCNRRAGPGGVIVSVALQ
jgi:hypothetical protein